MLWYMHETAALEERIFWMKMRLVRIADGVILRREYFGGILFHRYRGDVIEIDREAFALVSLIKRLEVADVRSLSELHSHQEGTRLSPRRMIHILEEFEELGVIETLPVGVLADRHTNRFEEQAAATHKWPTNEYLSAPETVHWAVTFACAAACPDCYIERHKKKFRHELATQEALQLIEKIADSGVFQLAIGGGEPLVRHDLEQLVRHASQRGLVVHVTTGIYEIEKRRLDALAHHLNTLQIGIRTEELLTEGSETMEKLTLLVSQLKERNIMTGANVIMTRTCIGHLEQVLDKLMDIGFRRCTLLRYKPPGDAQRWLEENPDANALKLLENWLARMPGMDKYEEMQLRIDCAFSFLERNLEAETALFAGIRGCVAFDRIMSVAPDGSVYPCSQLMGHKFRAGNLLHEDFASVWSSGASQAYRSFRKVQSFADSTCGKCKASHFCGGCRVFAEDALGADPGCPNAINDRNMLYAATDRQYPSWIG